MLYLFVLLISFIICYFLSPFIGNLGIKYNIVDTPGVLTIHTEPIPRTGGLAIVVAFLAAVTFGLIFSVSFGWGCKGQLWGILIGGVLIFFVGFFDDVKHLPAWIKFLGQLLAAVAVVFSGLTVERVKLFIHHENQMVEYMKRIDKG